MPFMLFAVSFLALCPFMSLLWCCVLQLTSTATCRYDPDTELVIFSDFAAQAELHGQDTACCGTHNHVNKDIFIVQRDRRTVEVDGQKGEKHKKTVHTTDGW